MSEAVRLLPKDAIRSIDAPSFRRVSSASPNELCIVYAPSDDQARAYPVRILNFHEIVNDEVAGVPIAVTWCPLCGSGVVYERIAASRRLTFGVSGKLLHSDLVMFDRETGSEWKQSSGYCISGQHKGKELTLLGGRMMSCGEFLSRFDNGAVLAEPAWSGHDYARDAFEVYARSEIIGPPELSYGGNRKEMQRELTRHVPSILRPKESVLGIRTSERALAFPRSVVERNRSVIRTVVDNWHLVVLASPNALHAYEDSGIELQKSEVRGRYVGDGTYWSAETGCADDGRRLAPIPSQLLFAFAWANDHGPDSFYLGE